MYYRYFKRTKDWNCGSKWLRKINFIKYTTKFLQPSKGKILIDDQDINYDIQNWHSRIGYIPQEIYLLDDTILKNVALGREINEFL